MKHRRTTAALAFFLMGSVACERTREAVATVLDISRVRNSLVAALKEGDIEVDLQSDGFLTISLVNSRLKALPPEQKHAKALEIARLALLFQRKRRDRLA